MAEQKKFSQDCIQCGRCLDVCPLFTATQREELTPRSKFTIAQNLGSEHLDAAAAEKLAAMCLACGRCSGVCAQKLDAPQYVADIRQRHPNFHTWLWKTWISKASTLWPMAANAAKILPESLKGILGKGPREGLRKMEGTSAAPQPWLDVVSHGSCELTEAVLFSGCTGDNLCKQWPTKAKRLLAGLGVTLKKADFACCGLTLGSAGLGGVQQDLRRLNVDAWRSAGRPAIVTYCATCDHGLQAYAEADLGWEEGEAQQWLASLAPLSSLLVETVFMANENAPAAVRYHKPCHAREADTDKALVARMAEGCFEPTENNLCCGFGGIMQLGAPELSNTVANHLWAEMDPEQNTLLLTGCSGCVMQLNCSKPEHVGVAHWLDALEL